MFGSGIDIKGLVVSDEGADLIADLIGVEIFNEHEKRQKSLYHLRKELVVVSTWWFLFHPYTP